MFEVADRGFFQVELSSGEEVVDVVPNMEQLKKCAGRGVIVTGQAPPRSGYDFFSRFFCPKFGIDEVMSFVSPKHIETAKLV